MIFRTVQQTPVLVTSFLLKHLLKIFFTSQQSFYRVKVHTKALTVEKLVAFHCKIQLTINNVWDPSVSSI